MMLHIPEVLSKPAVAELRALIDAADWIDGNATSGFGILVCSTANTSTELAGSTMNSDAP